MKNVKIFSAVVAALLLALMPVAAVASIPLDSHTIVSTQQQTHVPSERARWLWLSLAALGIAGTATITYAYPVAGTTPPTAIQASQVNVVTASVVFADADTTALVTHNLNIGTTTPFQMNTAQLFPEVIVYWSATNTAFAGLSIALTSGNVITLTKANVQTGTGGTAVVTIRRPTSAAQ